MDEDDPLAAALGRTPPAGLAGLSPAERADLAAAVRDAQRSQVRALAGALDASLKIVPRPLRPVLKKVLA